MAEKYQSSAKKSTKKFEVMREDKWPRERRGIIGESHGEGLEGQALCSSTKYQYL